MVKITQYAKNVAKSTKYAFINATADNYSNVRNFKETNSELFREVYGSLRDYKSTAKRIATKFKESPVYEISSMAIKNTLADIKTGDFYNQARMDSYDEQYGGDMFKNIGDFEISSLGFDPDTVDSLEFTDGDVLISRTIAKTNKVSANAIASAVVQSNANNAEVLKESTSMLYMQNIEIAKQTNANISTVGENMVKGFKDVSAIQNTIADNSLKFYNDTTNILGVMNKNLELIAAMTQPKPEEYTKKRKSTNRINDVAFGGIPDIKVYIEQIKKNLDTAIGDTVGISLSTIKSMDKMMGEGSSAIKMMLANPMQLVMEDAIKKIIPETLNTAMKNFDETLGNIFPAFIGRMNTLSRKDSFSGGSGLTRFIGKLLKLDTEPEKTVNLKVEKGPISWDSVSKKYLEEVIPYYLRKMTAALTGEKEMVFDTESGKWKSLSSIRGEFADNIASRPRVAFSDFTSEMKKAMQNVVFDSYDDKVAFDDDYKRFMKYVYDNGDIDLKGKRGREIGLKNDMSLDIIRKAIETVNPAVVMNLVNKIQQNKAYVSRMYKNIEGGSVLYKLASEGIDLERKPTKEKEAKVKIDNHINDTDTANYKGFNITKLTDKYNKTIYDYLNIINSNIEFIKNEGLITYPQGGGVLGGTPTETTSPSGTNVPEGYRERASASNGTFKRKETAESKLARIREEDESYYDSRVERYRRRPDNKVFVELWDDDSLADVARNMRRTYDSEMESQRRRMNSTRDASQKTLIQDIFNQPSDQEYRDRFSELTNFKDKWAMAETMGEKAYLVKEQLKSWIDTPSAIMERAIMTADKHIFDLFYRTSTEMVDDDGKPIAGFMDLLKYKTTKMFIDVKDNFQNIFGDAKDKLKNKFKDSPLGKWLEDFKQKLVGDEGSPFKMFTSALKDQFSGIKDSYKEAFQRASEALGIPEIRAELKAKQEQKSDEDKAKNISIESIVEGIMFANAQGEENIKKLISDTQYGHEVKSTGLRGADKRVFDEAYKKAKMSETAKSEYENLKRIANDDSFDEETRNAAAEKVKTIESRLMEVDGYDFDSARKSVEDKIKNSVANRKTKENELKIQQNLERGLDSNGNVIEYANEEERQKATIDAAKKAQELKKAIEDENKAIESYKAEAKRIKERQADIIDEMNDNEAVANLIASMAENPFEQLFNAVDKQREAFKAELEKAENDLKFFRERYTEINKEALEIQAELDNESLMMSPEELASKTAIQEELIKRANDMRDKEKEAKMRRDDAQAGFDAQPDAQVGAFKDALKNYKINSTVAKNIMRERRKKADAIREKLNDGKLRTPEQIEELKENLRKFELRMRSQEFLDSLNPKAKEFFTAFIQNDNQLAEFINSDNSNIDDATREKLTQLYANKDSFDVDEYDQIMEQARLKRVEIMPTLARGGVNRSSKPIDSIMSAGEIIHHKNGTASVVTSGPSIHRIMPGDSVINPADEKTIAKQYNQEKMFKKSLATNAKANNMLAPAKIAEAFKDNIGFEGLAKGAIGAGTGLLLSGNPLLGALGAISTQIIKSNQTINEALFGSVIEYDENGNPIKRDVNGLIKPYISKALPSMKNGALLGSVLGLVTPLGPIGGMLAGAGLGFFKNTQYAQDVLFGEGNLLSPENRNKIKRALPNMGIGAAAGALALGGPLGLIGGALVGGAGGLLTTTEKFKDAMFGEADANGKRDGGVVGALKHELLFPLKNFGMDLLDHVKETLKEDFFSPIKEAMTPITEELKYIFTFIPNKIADTFKDVVAHPIAAMVRDYIGEPLKKIGKSITKKITDVMLLPFKAVGKVVSGIGNTLRNRQIKKGRANYLTAAERNAERQKHKLSFMVGDKYKELDANLEAMSANSSAEDLTTMKNALLYNLQGERGLHEELRKTTASIDKKVADKFRVRKGNAGNAIMKAIKDEDYSKAFDLIKTTKSASGELLTKEESDNLIAELQSLIEQRDSIKNKQDTYKLTDDELAETAEKLGIKNFAKKSREEKKHLMTALQAEINSKEAANIKYGTTEEAAKVAGGLKDQTVLESNTVVSDAVEAINQMVFQLELNNELLQYQSGSADNAENIASARKARIDQQVADGVMSEATANKMKETIDQTVARHNQIKNKRKSKLEHANDAGYYEQENERFREKYIQGLYKFPAYNEDNLNEELTPVLFDLSNKDRARMLLDMAKKHWYIDKDAIVKFSELTDAEAEKIYNVCRFKWSGNKCYYIDSDLMDTIISLSKREAAKLGDAINEGTAYILKKWKYYPKELKDYLSTIRKKSKYNEFKRHVSMSESNNGIVRKMGRGVRLVQQNLMSDASRATGRKKRILDAITDDENIEKAKAVISGTVNAPKTVFKLTRKAQNAVADKVSTDRLYEARQANLINKMTEIGMFRDESYLSPTAIKSLTNDQLEQLISSYEHNVNGFEGNTDYDNRRDKAIEDANASTLERARAKARRKKRRARQLRTNAYAEDGLEPIENESEENESEEKETPKKGSKEEAEKTAEKKSFFDSIKGIKTKLGSLVETFSDKAAEKVEDSKSFIGKIIRGMGKVWFGVKVAAGIPIAVGFMSKYIVPFVKDKFLPWLIGTKNSSGEYEGGIASGIANSFKRVMVETVIPKTKEALFTAGGWMSDMWKTGADVIINDVLPPAVDLLMEKLPDIMIGALTAAWEVIKTGAKAATTKLGFGKSGDEKANSSITSAARSATHTAGNELSEYKIGSDIYKEEDKRGTAANIALSAITGPIGESKKGVAINNANAELYKQYKGVGTEFLEQNYADVMANNMAFQSVRDKDVQETSANGYGSKSLLRTMGRSFVNSAAGIGRGGRVAAKVGAKTMGAMSHIPVLGKVFKVGQGVFKTIDAPAALGEKLWAAANPAKAEARANGGIGKKIKGIFSKKEAEVAKEVAETTAKEVAEEVVEEAAEKGVKETLEAGAKAAAKGDASKKGKLITKISGFIKEVLEKLFGNSKIVKKLSPLAKKIGMSKKALAGKLKSVGKEIAERVCKKLGMESVETLVKVASKATVVLAIVFAVADFIAGWDNARNILSIVDAEVSPFERLFAGLTNVVSGLVAGIIPASTIVNILIGILDFLGNDYAENLKKRQEEAKEAVDLYNAENGTDFETIEDFNRAINPTMAQKVKSWVKDKTSKAIKGVKNLFNKKKSDDENAEEIATNAYANQGLDAFNPDAFSNSIDEAIQESMADLSTNARANDKLSPIKTAKNILINPINDFIGQFYGDSESIDAQLSRYKSMNSSINSRINSGKINVTDKKYWDISTGGDNTFVASLYRLSEFIRRAINSPLSIIQDAVNSVFEQEVDGVSSMNASGSSNASVSGTNTSSYVSVTSNVNKSKSESSKPKSKIASFFSNLFKKKSGKATVKNTEFKNLKHKYAIAPKPMSDETASYIKSQYSGDGRGEDGHLYQRDYLDRFNISGDSNTQTIADSGCGPVVASTVLQERGMKYDVRDAAKAALPYKEKDAGTYPEYFADYLGKKGIRTSNVNSRAELRRRLKSGESVILMGQSGSGKTPFGSTNPHYVLATGMKNNDIIVQDPEDTKANAIYNANDTIKDSIYAISTGKGKSGKLSSLGGRKRRSSGMGTLTANQENNLYNMLHELIILGEVGENVNYASVSPDDNGGMTFGAIGYHLSRAQEVLRSIAKRIPDADDKAFVTDIANKATNTSGISQGEATKLSEILVKYDKISREEQDAYAFKMYKDTNMKHPMKLFNEGYLKNPLSVLIPANIYNTGIHTGWADNWKPTKTGTDEIDEVAQRLITNSYWSSGTYSEGWKNRIRQSAEIVKGLDINNYTSGQILGNGFKSSASVSSDGSINADGSSAADNTFISKLAAYVKKAMKTMYGGVYDALFGGADAVDAATTGSNGASLGADDYLGDRVDANGADAWFLQTLEGSSVSSGYRTPDRSDHAGIDYAAAEGTKIFSPVDGCVEFSGWNTGGYGNLVIVKDTHGYYHIFGHQSQLPAVKEGEEVVRGSFIGLVGNTGHSFGNHLHYQVNKPTDMWHADVDPNKYDYSEYIANAKAKSTVSSDFVGPILPNQTRGEVSGTGAKLVKAAMANIHHNQSNSNSNKSKASAKTKNNSYSTRNTAARTITEKDIDRAINSVNPYESGSSSSKSCGESRYMPGARSGQNKSNVGGDNTAVMNEMLLAIVKLLGNVVTNTDKLNEVVALLTKITAGNVVQLQGSANKCSGNGGCNTKSGSGKSADDVMKELTKAFTSLSNRDIGSRGLAALNQSLQSMNSNEIIDAVYKIARQ